RGVRRLRLRRPANKPSSKRTSRRPVDSSRLTSEVGEWNETVFQALRAWRIDVAREHGVPAYTVFHDSTLREIATVLPRSLDELQGISGIGATKLERYGEALVDIVRRRS